MKDVIERILKEEDAARKRIEEAEVQAEEMVAKAGKEASLFTDDMIAKAADYARRKKDEYEHQFLGEKDRILQRIKQEAASLRKNKEKNIEPIAKRVFSQIITIQE
jgi:F0F1-type ATP synthase membrane subunit b/b'